MPIRHHITLLTFKATFRLEAYTRYVAKATTALIERLEDIAEAQAQRWGVDTEAVLDQIGTDYSAS